MPPVHDPHTLHGIQHHLEPTLIPLLLPALKRRVLKQQADTMVAHVCADVDCKLKQRQKPGSLSYKSLEDISLNTSQDFKTVPNRQCICIINTAKGHRKPGEEHSKFLLYIQFILVGKMFIEQLQSTEVKELTLND